MSVNLKWTARPIKVISEQARQQALAHFSQLTATSGSLGLFETLAVRMAGMQRNVHPTSDPARIVVFAADHGVMDASVCSLPKSATRSAVYDCLRGVSPIARMARPLEVDLELIDVGMTPSSDPLPDPTPSLQNGSVRFLEQAVGPGTTDFRLGAAMTHEQFSQALRVGRNAVDRAIQDNKRLFLGGEISIDGTLSATAVVSAVLKVLPEFLSGPGKGPLSPDGFVRRTERIQKGLDVHESFHTTAMEALRRLGGFEMAALTGAFIACGQRGLPAIVDGFSAATAAMVAIAAHPPLKEWLIFAHRAAEPGHLLIAQRLMVQPVLDLNIHHGEAVGAAAALPILRQACHLLAEGSSAEGTSTERAATEAVSDEGATSKSAEGLS